MELNLKSQDGMTLQTEKKYCTENITVIPTLQTKEASFSPTGQSITPDVGYAGLKEVKVAAIPNFDKYARLDVEQTFTAPQTFSAAAVTSAPLKDTDVVRKVDLHIAYVLITWHELKALRDNSQLSKGTIYRITDYQCTTTQFDTQSAGHQFDILVVADDVNALNENAHAICHNGDTYFAKSKLESWELKYCLDNDTTRFAWADKTNGKGIVYYMKDEFNNECPYDFKNIQFKRYYVYDDTANGELSDLDGKYLGYVGDTAGLTIDEDDFMWYYTFSIYNSDNDIITDMSLSSANVPDYDSKNICEQNIIKPMTLNTSIDESSLFGVLWLNKIVFIYDLMLNDFYTAALNFIDGRCFDMTFYNACFANTIEQDNRYIIAGEIFQQNTIKTGNAAITFGDECCFNILGNNNNFYIIGSNCVNNIFGNNNSHNTFGSKCSNNTFGGNCTSNTFGNGCYGNIFESDCSGNTFGSRSATNIFGNMCQSNIFGEDCTNNTFGNNCMSNTFGNSCSNNTFGNGCNNNAFGTPAKPESYATAIIFGNGVENISLNSSGVPAIDNMLQYIHIHSGVKQKIITARRGLPYSTDYYANNSQSIILD